LIPRHSREIIQNQISISVRRSSQRATRIKQSDSCTFNSYKNVGKLAIYSSRENTLSTAQQTAEHTQKGITFVVSVTWMHKKRPFSLKAKDW